MPESDLEVVRRACERMVAYYGPYGVYVRAIARLVLEGGIRHDPETGESEVVISSASIAHYAKAIREE